MNETVYVFGQDVNNYTPFESIEQINYNDNRLDDKFCPICHYNLKSEAHRKSCNNTIPIGDSILPMILLCSIYMVIKLFKN
jgi:hypothetical protein